MENTVDKIVEALKQVGETLQPYAKHGWEIIIRQSYIEAYKSVAWIVMLSVIIIVMRSMWRGIEKEDWDEAGLTMCRLGIVIVMTICIIGIGINIDCAIGYFLNPEYYALKTLIGK